MQRPGSALVAAGLVLATLYLRRGAGAYKRMSRPGAVAPKRPSIGGSAGKTADGAVRRLEDPLPVHGGAGRRLIDQVSFYRWPSRATARLRPYITRRTRYVQYKFSSVDHSFLMRVYTEILCK